MDLKKAKKILDSITSAEDAVKLKGKERKEYLDALTAAFGDKAKRSKDMGFGDRTWYHGSTVPIEKFQTEALGKSTGAQSAKKGFFFAEDPSTASDYADLARDKGIIREGDKVTTKWESELDNSPIDAHYRDIDEIQFEIDNAKNAPEYNKQRLENINNLKKQVENPKVWDWMKPAAQREGISPEQYAKKWNLDILKKAEQRAELPILSPKEIKELEKKYYSEVKKYASVKGDDKILDIMKERLKGNQLKKFQDAVNSGVDVGTSTGQQVLPVRLKGTPESIHVKDYKGQGYRDTTYADELTEMEKQGKDAALFRNTYDPADPNNRVKQDIAVVTKPNQIRSEHAAFDPRFKDSDLILAANKKAPQSLVDVVKDVGSKGLDALSYPQRKIFQSIAEGLGLKGSENNSEESAQAIVEKLASMAGVPEDSNLGNAAKALGVAGMEVFADPTNIIPVNKIKQGSKAVGKMLPSLDKLKELQTKVFANPEAFKKYGNDFMTTVNKAVDVQSPKNIAEAVPTKYAENANGMFEKIKEKENFGKVINLMQENAIKKTGK
jgi:hypothetical protein